MSNQAVGNVYQAVIDEVINSSRVDFEENGVEESVLEELRKGWQQKLSQLDVAHFPWDPKPDPPPPAPTVRPPPPPQQLQHQFSAVPVYNGPPVAAPYIKQEPGVVKQEPGTQAPALAKYHQYTGGDNANSVAANRAAQQLQAQYGVRAAGSINAIQTQGQQAQQPRPGAPAQAPAPAQGQTTPQQSNFQAAQPSASEPLANNQTDGAGDMDDEYYEGVLMERNAAGTLHELGRVDIDRIIHAKIAAHARSMEGGGLMMPLKESKLSTVDPSAKKRKDKGKGKGIAAFDGGDDDDDDEEEEDEDAINSDLDDPEESQDEDQVDDEGLGHIMLCTYDKVQRVKNKWKCTLKDGVLTVNGKEYLFHKATGEYEW